MPNFAFDSSLILFIQLLVAMVLGMLVGIERVIAHKTAGMRTYALVSMGSCLFVLVSQIVGEKLLGVNFMPMQIPAAIITGIGFLGAGLIIHHDDKISGLTTSTGLWITAGIGVAIGFKLYFLAIASAVLTLIVFTILWFVEEKIKRYFSNTKCPADEAASNQP